MTITYNLAPNPKWMAFDANGYPLIGARLYTYKAGTESFKTTYADKEGKVENHNPIMLDAKGQATIYWASDEDYYIELYDSNGQLILTQDNYNAVIPPDDKPAIIYKATQNFCRNGQFNEWSFGKHIDLCQMTNSPIMDSWQFQKTNVYSKDFVTRKSFAPGQSEVPANPIYYAEFSCTDLGEHGELYKGIKQAFQSVQTFANSEITFSFYAKSQEPLMLELQVIQDFGTGEHASAPVRALVTTFTLSATWQRYTATIMVPAINGKAIGTNEDDTFAIWIGFPINTVYNAIAICNVQLEYGNTATEFQYQPQCIRQELQHLNLQLFPTGWLQPIYSNVLPTGWIWANDGSIGNADSKASNRANSDTKALFCYLWNLNNDVLCPVSNGRGPSAETDFYANKTIQLPRLMGRCLIVSGQGASLSLRNPTEYDGKEYHKLTAEEIPPHCHTISPVFSTNGAMGQSLYPMKTFPVESVTSDGSEYGLRGSPHNIMQPWSAVPMMIKL